MSELMMHPMLKNISIERVVNYTVHFCRKWGASCLFTEKNLITKIENYIVEMPCDFYDLEGIRDIETRLQYRYSSDVYHNSVLKDNPLSVTKPVATLVQDKIITSGDNGIEAIDVDYHYERANILDMKVDLTYKLQGNVIVFSTTDNTVEIVYNAIESDDYGYPLIYDDSTYIQALKDYIKMQEFTVLFDTGKIQQNVFQNAQQQYAFSAKVLHSRINHVTPDQAESLSNIMNRMILHVDHHTGFKNTSSPNKFKIH